MFIGMNYTGNCLILLLNQRGLACNHFIIEFQDRLAKYMQTVKPHKKYLQALSTLLM